MSLKTVFESQPDRRYIMFGGKGGLGKTTLSATSAFWLASQGKRVLLFSVDPQASLSDIFQRDIFGKGPVPIMQNLWAQEVNADQRIRDYQEEIRKKILDMYGFDRVPEEIDNYIAAASAEPAMEESAIFDAVVDIIVQGDYDYYIYDLVPLGHALYYLSMAKVYDEWINKITRLREDMGQYDQVAATMRREDTVQEDQILGELTYIKNRINASSQILTDKKRTAFFFVVVPEEMIILDTQKAAALFAKFDVPLSGYIVNRVLPPDLGRGNIPPYLRNRIALQQKHMGGINHRALARRPGQADAPRLDQPGPQPVRSPRSECRRRPHRHQRGPEPLGLRDRHARDDRALQEGDPGEDPVVLEVRGHFDQGRRLRRVGDHEPRLRGVGDVREHGRDDVEEGIRRLRIRHGADRERPTPARHVEGVLPLGRQDAQVAAGGADAARNALVHQEKGGGPAARVPARVPRSHGTGAAAPHGHRKDSLLLRHAARGSADRGDHPLHRLVPRVRDPDRRRDRQHGVGPPGPRRGCSRVRPEPHADAGRPHEDDPREVRRPSAGRRAVVRRRSAGHHHARPGRGVALRLTPARSGSCS
ncbi:MAG: hypothetical protein DMD95_15025 [Candidatus Rokuibacteriota bacterium]|nr:MAG: hypothetical protein DMD95_15025 [Candidatus Rokubacteria bacterium]